METFGYWDNPWSALNNMQRRINRVFEDVLTAPGADFSGPFIGLGPDLYPSFAPLGIGSFGADLGGAGNVGIAGSQTGSQTGTQAIGQGAGEQGAGAQGKQMGAGEPSTSGGLTRTGGAGGDLRLWRPNFNVSETKDTYLITADIPGVDKNDINIELKNGLLTSPARKSRNLETRTKDLWPRRGCLVPSSACSACRKL